MTKDTFRPKPEKERPTDGGDIPPPASTTETANEATQRAEKLRSVLAGANETARRRGEQRDEARGRVAVLEAALRELAEIALNRDDVYGDPLLAIKDRLAGEFADEPLGAVLAGGDAVPHEFDNEMQATSGDVSAAKNRIRKRVGFGDAAKEKP